MKNSTRKLMQSVADAARARGLTLSRWRANGRRGVHNTTTYVAHSGQRPARSEDANGGPGIRVREGCGQTTDQALSILLAEIGRMPAITPITPAAVFVYGTLLRGLYNDRVLPAEAEERRVPATMPGVMYSCGGFPMCDFHSSPNGSPPIKGEVVFLRADMAARTIRGPLDGLEGCRGPEEERVRHGGFYERVVRLATLEDGTKVEAWVYTASPERAAYMAERERDLIVKSGDWRAHASDRNRRF